MKKLLYKRIKEFGSANAFDHIGVQTISAHPHHSRISSVSEDS